MREKFKKLSRVLSFFVAISICLSLTVDAIEQDPYRRLVNMVEKDKEFVEKQEKIDEEKEVLYIVEVNEKAIKDYAGDKDIEECSKDEKLVKKVLASQEKYKDEILKIYSEARFKNEYTILLNGFSVFARVKDQEKIEAIKGVKHLSISKDYERDMSNAIDLGRTKEIYENYGYKGEGMLVSVIDSGIDYKHKDMVLTGKGKKKAKLSEDDVKKLIKTNGFEGSYFTDKVPYGCNYIDDEKDAVIDKAIGNVGYMHGMHVSGIIAGNCQNHEDVKNGNGVVGLAPEAQIIAMKIFSNNPQMNNATEADVISAIEDSVALGADVINMSISGSAGFQDPNDGQQKAIREAVNRGVIVIVAGGNAYYSTYPNKMPDVIDTSTIGAPGITEDCIQVASMDNTKLTNFLMRYNLGGKEQLIPYSMTDFDIKTLKGSYELVDCGLGLKDSDFSEDLKGKIALIQRGQGDFSLKKVNAQNKGAKGVIIYNYDGDEELLQGTAYDKEVLIPSIFIKNSDGIKLKTLISKNIKVDFPHKISQEDVRNNMSEFSSWGPAPNLNLKPDLTGVGGNIWSTVNYDSYRSMSGTSMATPYVSGASLLMKQHLGKSGLNLEDSNIVDFNKMNLMNTARIRKDNELPVSPRKQGAGLISLEDAVKNNTLISYENKASISLKEIDLEKEFEIKVKNYGKVSLEYELDKTDILTDMKEEKGELTVKKAVNSSLSFDKGSIKLSPNEEVIIKVSLKLDKNFEKNSFVEGFIKLNSKDSEAPDLSIPYLGFYGKWDDFKNIDKPAYEKDSLLKETTLVSMNQSMFGNEVFYIGSGKDGNPEHFAINPSGEYSIKNVLPQVTLFRNLKEMSIDIVDNEEKTIRSLGKKENFKKNVFPEEVFHGKVDQDWIWDGKAYNKATGSLEVVKDGQYYMDFRSKIDFDGAKEQVTRFPVKIDSKGPSFNTPSIVFIDSDKMSLDMKANDGQGSGVAGFVFIVDEKEYKTESGASIFKLKSNDGNYKLDLDLPVKDEKIIYNGYFGCLDYAKNLTPANTIIIDKRKSNLDIKLDKEEYKLGENVEVQVSTDKNVFYYEATINDDRFNKIKTNKSKFLINSTLVKEKNVLVVKAYDKNDNLIDANAVDFKAIEKEEEFDHMIIRDISKKDYFHMGDYAPISIKASNFSKETKDVTLIVNLYDEKDNLSSVVSCTDSLEAGEESILSTDIILPNTPGYRLEISVWDNLDNQKPYIGLIKKAISSY